MIQAPSIFGQEENNHSGFSIVGGLSYNTLFWETEQYLTQEETILNRNQFWLQPNFRISYSLNLFKLKNKVGVSVAIFSGFNSFGGKSKTEDSGYKDYLLFKSVEFGLQPVYSFNKYEANIGIKGQYIFSAKSKAYGTLTQDENLPREWSISDASDLFKDYSLSFGFGGNYKIRGIYVGIETWFGISNLGNIEDVHLQVLDNNYRFLLRFNF